MAAFSMLSPHGQTLLRIAQDPDVRLSEIADELSLTAGSVQRIVADLISAGHISRHRTGRRATFSVVPDQLEELMLAFAALEATVPRAAASTEAPTKQDEIRVRLTAAVETILEDEETFAELSVERLIRGAGISRSTFYSYFRDKDDLLRALVEDLLKELWGAAIAWTDLGADITKGDLRAAMDHISAVHRPHRLLMAAAAEADPTNARIRQQYDGLMEHTKEMIKQHILRGQRDGFVRLNLDATLTSALLTWGSERRLSTIASHASGARLALVSQALSDLIWNLLYADAEIAAGAEIGAPAVTRRADRVPHPRPDPGSPDGTGPDAGGPEASARSALIAILIPAMQRILATGVSYPKVTVTRLTAEAGISRWQFYSQFRDKHELLHAWFEQLNAEFAQTHDGWLHINGTSQIGDLREAMKALFIPYGSHSTLHAAMYDAAAADPVVRNEVDATEERRITSLTAHIEQGQAAGWVDQDLLARETAEWLVMTGSRSYQRMVVTTRQVSTSEFMDSYTNYIWLILYAPPRRREIRDAAGAVG